MKLAAEGLSNKDIGLKLNITAGTAKNHLHRIFEKVGVKNRTALASLLIQASSTGNLVPSEGRVPPAD
jgi:DNA-binding NarL/FixJ family response regulator